MLKISDLIPSKKPPLLGLDISATSVKLLEMSRSGNRYRVESYAIEPLPPNAVVESSIADVEGVGDAIKRAVKRSGSRAKLVAAAVAGSSVITKVIPMAAALSEDEIESNIEFEADQYIPYPLEEVNLDFEVIGPSESDPEQVDVLLVASRKENVDVRVDALEAAGLVPKVIDVEAYAMENAFSFISSQVPDNGIEKTVAVIDIGATMTTIVILQDQKIIYTREQAFGGQQLTEEIQTRYGLSHEEAAMAKRQGGLPENYDFDVLEPFKQSMAQQVSRALQFFYSASEYTAVDAIVLAGGSSCIENVNTMIEESEGGTDRRGLSFLCG